MIWYSLQHHQDATGLEWLLDRLRHERTFVDCAIDQPADDQLDRLSGSGRPNFSCRLSPPVLWGGPSLVTSFLDAMRRAVESPLPWEYFINLSGSCVPLRSQGHILAALATLSEMNVRACVFGYGSAPIYVPEPDDAPGFDACVHSHEATPLPVLLSPAAFSVSGPSRHRPESPVHRAGLRLGLRVRETPKRTLEVRGLTPLEIAHREALFRTFRPHVGRAWFILHRSVCEWLLGAIEGPLRALHDELLTSFISDETYVPTMVFGTGSRWAQMATIANFRLGHGAPMNLSAIPPEAVALSPGFFARKLALSAIEYRRRLDAAGQSRR